MIARCSLLVLSCRYTFVAGLYYEDLHYSNKSNRLESILFLKSNFTLKYVIQLTNLMFIV